MPGIDTILSSLGFGASGGGPSMTPSNVTPRGHGQTGFPSFQDWVQATFGGLDPSQMPQLYSMYMQAKAAFERTGSVEEMTSALASNQQYQDMLRRNGGGPNIGGRSRG